MSIDAMEGIDEDVYFSTHYLDDEKEEDVEDMESTESLARHIINAEDGAYSPEEVLQAKAALIPSEYQHLADLCETGKDHLDSSSVEELSDEMQRQQQDAALNKDLASTLPNTTHERGYNLAQEMLTLFLGKEQSLDNLIKTKGKNLVKLNQLSSNSNHLKNLLSDLENLENELGEASKADRPKIQEQMEKIKVEISQVREKLEGEEIKTVQSFFGISPKTVIELPGVDNLKGLKGAISRYMDEMKLRINQGFSSLQEDFTTKMACFESTKNALKHFEESISKIVRNQRPNG